MLPAHGLTILMLLGGQPSTPAPAQIPLVVENDSPLVGSDGVTREALGMETLGGILAPLIPAGTKVPSSKSATFSTVENGQTQIAVVLFRGKTDLTSQAHRLGRFRVTIAGAPRGTARIEITFSVSGRRILLSARDLARGTDLPVERAPDSDEGGDDED
jgi:molecular chaperone DnaK